MSFPTDAEFEAYSKERLAILADSEAQANRFAQRFFEAEDYGMGMYYKKLAEQFEARASELRS